MPYYHANTRQFSAGAGQLTPVGAAATSGLFRSGASLPADHPPFGFSKHLRPATNRRCVFDFLKAGCNRVANRLASSCVRRGREHQILVESPLFLKHPLSGRVPPVTVPSKPAWVRARGNIESIGAAYPRAKARPWRPDTAEAEQMVIATSRALWTRAVRTRDSSQLRPQIPRRRSTTTRASPRWQKRLPFEYRESPL